MDGGFSAKQSAGWHLSLVIPAFNEEAGILQAVAEADVALAKLCADYEILVVDDGSQDQTASIIEKEIRLRPKVRLLRHERNQGYGAALRTGFSASRFDRVAFTDADCQFHLEDLGQLLELSQNHDLAVGYRIGRKDPVQRRFYSWGYNVLIRALMGTRVRDCDCALKVFRRDRLLKLLPETSGFFINTEMLTKARQMGFSIAQTGVQHRPRLRGCSKVSLMDIPRTLSALLPFWWSRVVFVGRPPREGSSQSPLNQVLGVALLLVAAALLLFTHLRNPLQEPQEARYAEIPRQMLEARSWIVPVLHGQPYLDKPPLLYWLVMGSYSAFGVHDWAARLVPSLAILLTIGITYLWGRGVVGHAAGLAGAGILCLSARFIFLGRFLTMDAVLCLFTLASLAAAHWAIATGPSQGGSIRRTLNLKWWILSATMGGLAFMTKGPIALVLVLVPVVFCQLLDHRLAPLRVKPMALFLSISLGMAFPWFVAVGVKQPDFLVEFFWRHNVERFVHPWDHQEPLWYYFPSLLLGMLPWTLLIPGLVVFLGHQSLRTAMRRPSALGFFVAAALWGLAFFSISGCKRAFYVLPVMPPTALALGFYLAIGQPGAEMLRLGRALMAKGFGLGYQATLVVLILAGCAAGLAYNQNLLKPGPAALAMSTVGAALIGVGILGSRLPSFRAWWMCAFVTFAVLFGAVSEVLPAYARKYSMRTQVRALEPVMLPASRVACYPHGWDSISFYAQGTSLLIYDDKARLIEELSRCPDTVLYLRPGKTTDDLLRALPANLQFDPIESTGIVTVGHVRPIPGPASLFDSTLHENFTAGSRKP